VFPDRGPQGSEKDEWLQHIGGWSDASSQLVVAREQVIEQYNNKTKSGSSYNMGYIKATG
jgi:hypothetical protein